MKNQFFETASFHIVKPCNMKCKFCYATFDDQKSGAQMPSRFAKDILSKLRIAGLQKITFAGGEPLLYRYLDEVIMYAKSIGLVTGIITNGSLLTREWLRYMTPCLDWVGLSVDSIKYTTNFQIGRVAMDDMSYYNIVDDINHYGYKLKINTVVNTYNKNESLEKFIGYAQPERWKILQALPVKGQNDKWIDSMSVSSDEFNLYVDRHSMFKNIIVPESNELMTGSYLLIDPRGCLFENSSGEHTYSRPLQFSNVDSCMKEINVNRETFLKRGGVYEW